MENVIVKLIAFINARTWAESQHILEESPELLHPNIDALMHTLAMTQDDETMKQVVEVHRRLLARCREVGIAQAFGEQGGAEDEIAIPPGFEADIVEVQQLLAQVEQGP